VGKIQFFKTLHNISTVSTVFTRGVLKGVWGGSNPPPEIPKALENHAKLNVIVKTVKNYGI
jgi:hypothetical protein